MRSNYRPPCSSYRDKGVCTHSMMDQFFIYISIHVWLSMRVPILFQKPTKSTTCKLYFWKASHNFWGHAAVLKLPSPMAPLPSSLSQGRTTEMPKDSSTSRPTPLPLKAQERGETILLQSHLYLSCSVTVFVFRFTTALLQGVNPCAPTGWLVADSHVSCLVSSLHRGSLALVGCCC